MLFDFMRKNSNISDDKLVEILNLGRSLGYWSRGYDYPQSCHQIYENLDLSGKRVLEIGCGKGLFSFWASLSGASKVTGLEPLEEGSFDSSEIYTEFKKIVDTLELENIDMLPTTIQDYQKQNEYYDIVLSVASINHLDEDSCTKINESRVAREIYIRIFSDIADRMKPGAKLIILDCSSKNFFADMGLINPFGKSIEWFKHQTPDFWSELLTECGFSKPKITWPSGRFLRYLGIYKRNKILSYFTDSYFRLEMTSSSKHKSE